MQVKAVEPGAVVVKQGKAKEDRQVAYGTCIWTTGNKMHPLADDLAQRLPHGKNFVQLHLLPRGGLKFATLMLKRGVILMAWGSVGEQEHWRALKTDKYLRVHGTDGAIFALGDAATVSQVQ